MGIFIALLSVAGTFALIYFVIKMGVSSGIKKYHDENDGGRYERDLSYKQDLLSRRYEKGEISFDEYQKEWDNLK